MSRRSVSSVTALMAVVTAMRSISKTIGAFQYSQPTGISVGTSEVAGKIPDVKNIFRTFSTGVNGTPMPSFADNTTVEERWHIANFVNSLCEREADGTPLSIDQLTDKPKVNFVLSSGVILDNGEIPADPENDWQKRARRIIAMGGQMHP